MEKPGAADARVRRDVGELAAADVAEQPVAAERGDVDVDVAVVVVVRGGHAQAVHLDGEPRLLRDIGERAVAIVAIERQARVVAAPAGPVMRVDEQDVLPAVAVDIQERATPDPIVSGRYFLPNAPWCDGT